MRPDAVDEPNTADVATLLRDLRAEVHQLAGRLATLERHLAGTAVAADDRPTALAGPAATVHAAPQAAATEATEEDLLVIAAAVAAFLGVRARIRHVRLLQSSAWAQVGRATVHASHRVH
jgi:methylmalonyl-CoA carboxyltransferase large subunit